MMLNLALALAVLRGVPLPAPRDAMHRSSWDRLAAALSEARVGQWVTYALRTGDGWRSYIRIAVVGEATDSLGRPAQWVEVEIGQHSAFASPLAQARALVARGPGPLRDRVSRLFLAQGADPPLEVETGTLIAWLNEKGRAGDPTSPGGTGKVQVGKETLLMTPVGSVPAVPVEIYDRGVRIERLWMSRSVPVLRLAKWEFPAIRHLVEVVGHGLDATARMILPPPNSPKIRMDPSVGEAP
jgi:hypothetical protein